MYFDEQAMVFKSHSINIQRGETVIEYRDIERIEKRNTCFIVPNGISVYTKDGFEHKFVVNGRSQLIEFLNDRISK